MKSWPKIVPNVHPNGHVSYWVYMGIYSTRQPTYEPHDSWTLEVGDACRTDNLADLSMINTLKTASLVQLWCTREDKQSWIPARTWQHILQSREVQRVGKQIVHGNKGSEHQFRFSSSMFRSNNGMMYWLHSNILRDPFHFASIVIHTTCRCIIHRRTNGECSGCLYRDSGISNKSIRSESVSEAPYRISTVRCVFKTIKCTLAQWGAFQ